MSPQSAKWIVSVVERDGVETLEIFGMLCSRWRVRDSGCRGTRAVRQDCPSRRIRHHR